MNGAAGQISAGEGVLVGVASDGVGAELDRRLSFSVGVGLALDMMTHIKVLLRDARRVFDADVPRHAAHHPRRARARARARGRQLRARAEDGGRAEKQPRRHRYDRLTTKMTARARGDA